MKTSLSLQGQAVVLEPATSADNILQPLIDAASPLVIRQHSAGQSAALLSLQDALGNVIGGLDASGALVGASASPSGAVILGPATSARNTIQPTADTATGLVVKSHSATQSAPIASIQSANGLTKILEAFEPNTGVFNSVVIAAGNAGDEALAVLGGPGGVTGTGAAPALHCASRAAAGAETSDMNICLSGGVGTPLATDGGWAMHLGATDTGNLVRVGGCFPSFANAGHELTYTTRWQWQLWDSGGGWLEAMRFETNASVAMISFLGGNAVVKQTGASAAGIGSITDANAKAAITALQNALAAYNLVTAPV